MRRIPSSVLIAMHFLRGQVTAGKAAKLCDPKNKFPSQQEREVRKHVGRHGIRPYWKPRHDEESASAFF